MYATALASAAIGFAGAGLLGFWTWARSRISKQDVSIAELNGRLKAIEERCVERRNILTGVEERIDILLHEVREQLAELLSRLATIEGRLSRNDNNRRQ